MILYPITKIQKEVEKVSSRPRTVFLEMPGIAISVLRQCSSNFNVHLNPGKRVKMYLSSDSGGLLRGWGCISKKLPGDDEIVEEAL